MTHPDNVVAANTDAAPGTDAGEDAIAEWLRSRIAKLTGLEVADVSPTTTFNDLGLNSSLVVTLTEELSDWSDVSLDVTAMYEKPNIETLAQFLVEQQVPHHVT
jgi:acyl carrier protein